MTGNGAVSYGPSLDPISRIPSSALRFPDGAAHRVEIPSVEGPRVLEAVIEEAQALEVPVARVSQGSGIMMLLDDEITEMVEATAALGIELCLFARPTAGWGTGAAAVAPSGGTVSGQVRGVDQLRQNVEQIERAVELGVRSILLTDLGLLDVIGQARANGRLPEDLIIKASVQMGLSNPAAIAVAERLGLNTYNVPSDLSVAELAEVRRAVRIPLDVYIESPDDIGGFVRHGEIAEIVRVAAPVYVKFGIRNAEGIYPTGRHLEETAVLQARERVRRARIGLDMLERASRTTATDSGRAGSPAALTNRIAEPEAQELTAMQATRGHTSTKGGTPQ